MLPPGLLTWIRDNSVSHVYLPAIFENACLLSIARWPIGNLTNRPTNAAIMRDIVRIQRPAVDLDTSVASPINKWMAPVAKKRRQTKTCSNAGKGLLRYVSLARLGKILSIYIYDCIRPKTKSIVYLVFG